MCNECNHGKVKFAAGAILGGLIGAGVVYLFGTEGGKRVQKDIAKRGKKVIDEVEEKIEELEEKGRDLLDHGEKLKEKIVDELEDKKEDLSHEATKRLETALESVEKVQEKGLSTTQQLRKRFFRNTPKR